MRVQCHLECGSPARVPAGGRWERGDDRGDKARPRMVPGDGEVLKA